MYCVYIIFYKGNKLPPFYIGSTSVDRLKTGYRGTVSSKKYKDIFYDELKNNPHLFDYKIIKTFNNRNDALVKEDSLQRSLNVVESPLYINCGYATTGCFGQAMNGAANPFFGKTHTEDAKKIIGKASKERMTTEQARYIRSKVKTSWLGKTHSQESKLAMSIHHKNLPQITCPHCNKTGHNNLMKRWHFDKCKHIGPKV